MEEAFEFVVTIKVRVPAFDVDDAKEAIQDTFGPGSECGLEVTSLSVKQA